jgi:protein-S-isoprenylcysteine O-methyltransferase Ste14
MSVSPGPRVIAVPWNLIGVAFVVLGIGLNVIGDRQFQRAKTAMNPFGEPRVFITTGVFRYSQHLMYLGMVLLTSGLAIFIGYVTPFAGPGLLWAVLNRRFIPHEEHTMSRCFGQQYERYRTSTRRWL